MLEGLEAVEINFKQVYYSVETIRYDSEYYLKSYLNIEKIISENPTVFIKFSKLGLAVDGSAFYPALEPFYEQGDYPFIRVGDVKQIVDFENCVKVPFEILGNYPTLKHVKNGDIVLTKGGTIGLAGLITKDACVSRDLIFINSSVLPKADYITLYFFLSSKFCYNQLIRSSSQSVQPHLTITLVRELLTFTFTNTFKSVITEIYERSFYDLQQSKTLFNQAENILLEELGLAKWQPTIKNNNTKTLQESFLQTGRIDAEYYQPKYDEMLQRISQFENMQISQLVNVQKSIEPGSDAYQTEGIPFIRVADLSKNGLTESSVYLCKDEFANYSLMPKKDTILLSKDGSVGIAYKVNNDVVGITSSAILHLTVTNKKVLPDYLCLVLNSIIVKLQAERDAGGSIIQHWKPSEIEQVLIPILSIKTQTTISQKIQESFALQAQSKELLEAAKTAVEVAIEKGEKEAMEYLKKQINVK